MRRKISWDGRTEVKQYTPPPVERGFNNVNERFYLVYVSRKMLPKTESQLHVILNKTKQVWRQYKICKGIIEV